jgi:hypothetical protein
MLYGEEAGPYRAPWLVHADLAGGAELRREATPPPPPRNTAAVERFFAALAFEGDRLNYAANTAPHAKPRGRRAKGNAQ